MQVGVTILFVVTRVGYFVNAEFPEHFSTASTDRPFNFRDDDEEAWRPHYALHPSKTESLAITEEHIVKALRYNLPQEDDEGGYCAIYLAKYIHEFEQDIKAVKWKTGAARAALVAENPILTLKMIRRMVRTLMTDVLESCAKLGFSNVGIVVNDVYELRGMNPPTEKDLEDALNGLLRIQFVYGFNATKDLRLGKINGLYTGAFLYFDDCLALAKMAIELRVEAQAYQWLISAPLSPPEFDSPPEHQKRDMREMALTWKQLQNLTNTESKEHVHLLLRDRRQSTWIDYSYYSLYAPCRGESKMPNEMKKDLLCYYEPGWDPYFFINPLKVEVLSTHPAIFQFYDFVGPETIDVIRKSAASDMRRSGVTNSEESLTEFTQWRTSMQSWVRDTEEENPHPRLVTLNRRIEKLTGLEVQKRGASNLQVAIYGSLGGYYDFHDDDLQETTAPIPEGDRIATFLMFLNDVKMGGYTGFSRVQTFAKPIKGSAILFYNLKIDGTPDKRLTHGGCPVIMGTKEVANRWILQYENMWTHPCIPVQF